MRSPSAARPALPLVVISYSVSSLQPEQRGCIREIARCGDGWGQGRCGVRSRCIVEVPTRAGRPWAAREWGAPTARLPAPPFRRAFPLPIYCDGSSSRTLNWDALESSRRHFAFIHSFIDGIGGCCFSIPRAHGPSRSYEESTTGRHKTRGHGADRGGPSLR